MLQNRVLKQGLLVGLALMGAGLGYALKLPLGILIGSFLFIAAAQVFGMGFQPFSKQVKQIIQMLIGGIVGLNLKPEMLDHFVALFIPGLLVALCHILFALLMAFLLTKFFGVDWTTAICGTIPAGMSEIAAVSEEAGADVQKVMLMHLFRISFIIIILPLVISYLI